MMFPATATTITLLSFVITWGREGRRLGGKAKGRKGEREGGRGVREERITSGTLATSGETDV